MKLHSGAKISQVDDEFLTFKLADTLTLLRNIILSGYDNFWKEKKENSSTEFLLSVTFRQKASSDNRFVRLNFWRNVTLNKNSVEEFSFFSF